MKILIVDDKGEDLYLLETVLKGSGYEVASATDGVEALEKASDEDFDIIIADVLMPRMDGFQLCREVKKDEKLKKIAFVFYTATYTDPKDEEFALSLGAEKFIVKPTEPDVFVEILKDVIRSYEAGNLIPARAPVKEEAVHLREYNERLIKKLEDKMVQLERVSGALGESEKEYRELVDNANDAIIAIEHTGYLSFVNPKFCETLGYTTEEAKELHFSKMVHPEDLDMVAQNFRGRLGGENVPRNYEFRGLTKSGEVVYAELNATPIRREGTVVGIQAVVRDITERKRAEEEKENLQSQLLQSQKMEAVGTLAGGVAHDFNNLLTVINGYAELVLSCLGHQDPMREDVEEIRKAGERAASLTRQLLAFSRRQTLQPRVLDVNAVVTEMDKMLRRLIGEDIAISTELESSLWRVSADVGSMEQVIMNLVINARDAMPEGGKIIIKTENATLDEEQCKAIPDARPGRYVCLSITDMGEGMGEETLQHIFEPFFTTKEAGKGSGLGLAVIYGVVRQHEGWIAVESEPGQGSRFKVYFPTSAVEAEEEITQAFSLEQVRGTNERILVVEDDERVRSLATRVLAEKGYAVLEAASAEEALDVFEKEGGEFDLILCDVVLPGRTGIELVRQLRSRKPEIRVLLCSGYTDQKSQWTLIQKCGFPFLQKPYSASDLLRGVKEVLGTARSKPAGTATSASRDGSPKRDDGAE